MAIKAIREFLKLEAAGGIMLAGAAAIALIVANTPLYQIYQEVLDFTINIPLGQDGKYKSVLLLINDGLMAVFFLLIGLGLIFIHLYRVENVERQKTDASTADA